MDRNNYIFNQNLLCIFENPAKASLLTKYFDILRHSICLIALDRHHMIVNATTTGHSKAISFGYILIVWICAAICAIPIIPNTTLDVVELSPGRRFNF